MLISSLIFSSIILSILAFDLSGNYITGGAISGNLALLIQRSSPLELFIDSPENKSYNFNVGEFYLIDLNVSSTDNISFWWYELRDLKHDSLIQAGIYFQIHDYAKMVKQITVFCHIIEEIQIQVLSLYTCSYCAYDL